MFKTLNADMTVATIHTLQKRINRMFPCSGLSRVCKELSETAEDTKRRISWIGQPLYGLRILVGLVLVIGLAGIGYSLSLVDFSVSESEIGELIQTSEAGLNDVVLLGAAVFFLVTVENRIKRKRTLQALHELRSIAHVIDMHQLTKDPNPDEIVMASIPEGKQPITGRRLSTYLDYCSEMLSLTGKVGALYAQNLNDPVVLNAVTEIEELTTGLSRKIWQKIMILERQLDLAETNGDGL